MLRIREGKLINQIGSSVWPIYGFTASYGAEVPKFNPATRSRYIHVKRSKNRKTITGFWRVKKLKVRYY